MSRWGTVMTFRKCGHEAHVYLSHQPSKERLRDMAAGLCPACQGQGSEKQILWATDVRRKQLTAVEKHLREWRLLIEAHERSGKTEKSEQARAKYREALDALGHLEAETSAHRWIEMREATVPELLAGVRA